MLNEAVVSTYSEGVRAVYILNCHSWNGVATSTILQCKHLFLLLIIGLIKLTFDGSHQPKQPFLYL